MSWEAWGSGAEPPDIDGMIRRGWECDPDGKVWWKTDSPENKMTFAEAVESFESWRRDD